MPHKWPYARIFPSRFKSVSAGGSLHEHVIGIGLSSLNNSDPRVTWQMHIVDDSPDRSGFILGAWCLILNY